MAEEQPSTGDTSGIDPKLAALLCYLISIVGGIIFYVISKDKFVRFHALQSIFLGIVFVVLDALFWFVPIIWFFGWVVWLGFIALSVIMMIKAYQGEKYKLPILGDIAEKNS